MFSDVPPLLFFPAQKLRIIDMSCHQCWNVGPALFDALQKQCTPSTVGELSNCDTVRCNTWEGRLISRQRQILMNMLKLNLFFWWRLFWDLEWKQDLKHGLLETTSQGCCISSPAFSTNLYNCVQLSIGKDVMSSGARETAWLMGANTRVGTPMHTTRHTRHTTNAHYNYQAHYQCTL